MSRASELRPMVWLGALVLVVGACAGCSGGRTAEGDVYVEDPTTLEVVRALNAPPTVVVNVERVTHARGGSGGACHSAACLVLLPVVLVGALLPPEVTQHATVTTDGEPSYIARSTRGACFWSARCATGTTGGRFGRCRSSASAGDPSCPPDACAEDRTDRS